MQSNRIADALTRIRQSRPIERLREQSRARSWIGLGLLAAALGALIVAVRQQPFRPR